MRSIFDLMDFTLKEKIPVKTNCMYKFDKKWALCFDFATF